MPINTDEQCGDGKHIFGTVKVGERGQIVIPKEARDIFGINPGDTLMVLGDEKRGIALVKAEKFQSLAEKMLTMFEKKPSNTDTED
ncbi:MAG: AbrB/MazE/SpoVT family DNA-binding domain-containing protein [Methanospirillum sp.]|uniref:AbrB/MazE/SpoVT family DNA-binding domain-containing protein n=1 Tax=Methanospirillum sp. TaxID=45200 RepID=UPI002372D4AD|nr:AbrB/MazE/SpoVT family DNA-binding domain-containing protein [Methanospirillum sp.]MDD1728134.1 AbrB/MazE/SpoVT family DNA-binding domain-containing protein [Methanospirillum sp.]